MLKILFYFLIGISLDKSFVSKLNIIVNSKIHPVVTFDYWYRKNDLANKKILVLVPGHNGSGAAMFTSAWRAFATKYHLILMAPTFTVTDEELAHHQGYYYPDQGSGQATEDALQELGQREHLSIGKVLIFGFSAGAHFAHRFALWKPDRVRAFVAYSAAWWDDPNEKLAQVPALIMCGESDPRYDATWQFMSKGLALNLPWVWRSYEGTGHEMTPAVQRMAETFLGHYASDEPDSVYYGDVQSYQYVSPDKIDTIVPQERIRLPSKEIADTWTLEK